ncbi:MAG TPA: stage II sporulation protein P [Syntrophomonadaceae bacterium]|nr:stage II sporulation protein P [Syntrophomonadaceae bacterium]HPR94024.1 stage II sporulation protein P [Syntrophomonadaceae bacterium]
MKKNKILLILILSVFCLSINCGLLYANTELPSGQYYTLINENNQIIHQTGLEVNVGDEYITADNSRYRVNEIDGLTASCIYLGEETMPVLEYSSQRQAWIFKSGEVPAISSNQPTIAIYHTHSDESYVPSDGTESIAGRGGIYDVGESLAKQLKKLGFNVDYSENNHNPHDINAYTRSRRTAASLLKKNPDLILDVHRDATPAEQYQTEVEGKEVTKVKLVIGRQNPKMQTNLEFAKKIKALMDKKEPGLSNGIFIGKSTFNQDLHPRSVLIEVGAHTNDKTEAEKGVELFAQTLPAALGVTDTSEGGAAKKPLTGDSQGAGTTIAVILAVVAAAVGGFYFLNKGKLNR